MIKKTIKYVDYNGVEKTEDFYFNLNKAEIIELELGTDGGYTNYAQKLTDTKDTAGLVKEFKRLILMAYGKKTADGEFIKNEENTIKFVSSEAYSELIMDLLQNPDNASDFFKGITSTINFGVKNGIK